MTKIKPLKENSGWYKLGIFMIVSVFASIFIHELGHYSIAKYYGLNPEIHFGNYNKEGYSSAAYVTHDYTDNVKETRQVALGGNYAMLCIGALCSIYLFIKSKSMDSLVMVCVVWLLFYIMLSLMLAYNPMIYPEGSDIWQIIELN